MTSDSWRRNVYLVTFAQFLVVAGFASVNPFLPLYLQGLGSLSNSQAAFWGGMAIAASPLAMFLSSPLWGMAADRWGRKPMVIRAMFGSGLVLACVPLMPDVYWVVGLRFFQGLLSGSVGAASALVASGSPREKLPFIMGLLMAAVFAGATVGPLLGGIVADTAGFQASFYITGGLLFIGGFIVLVFVKERFAPTPKADRASLKSVLRLSVSPKMLPLLAAICALQIGPQMILPIIPLFIAEVDPAGAAATLSGVAIGSMGAIAAVSAWVFGRLGTRVSLKRVVVYSCLGCAAVYLPPFWAATVVQLIAFVALLGLFKGGLMASSNSLVGLSVPAAQHGMAYGLSQSANALGNSLGPLIGGSLAAALGLRPVFAITAALFLVLGLLMARFLADASVKKEP